MNRLRWLLRTPSFEDVERAERVFYRNYVRRGMTVFDVGAHDGGLTALFSELAGDGAVHAFEPTAATFTTLAARLAEQAATNVSANQVALSDETGTVRMHCYDGPYRAFNSMAERPLAAYGVDAGPARCEEVIAVTLDAYCAEHGVTRIDLLKVDVEGAELQVLRGARGLLSARRIACIAFEFGQTTFDMGNTPGELKALFGAHGYRLTNIVPGARLFPGGRSAKSAKFAMHLAMPA